MNKKEFLDILREALKGEVTPTNMEQNIQYYDQYIGMRSKEEEERIILELGDPRLIAKSLIEVARTSKRKKFADNSMNQESYTKSYDEDRNQRNQKKRQSKLIINFKWYHKLIVIASIILFILFMLLIGRIILLVLFTFGLPILLILLLYSMFRR